MPNLKLQQSSVTDNGKTLLILDTSVNTNRDLYALVLVAERRTLTGDVLVSNVLPKKYVEGALVTTSPQEATGYTVPVEVPGLYRYTAYLLPRHTTMQATSGLQETGYYYFHTGLQQVVKVADVIEKKVDGVSTIPATFEYSFIPVANLLEASGPTVTKVIEHGAWEYDYRRVYDALVAYYHTDRCRDRKGTRELYEDLGLAIDGLRANTAFGYYTQALHCFAKADLLVSQATERLD
jgi:hypothetical protein